MATGALWRSQSIFLTSTFRDMHAERDHLRNHVFPELQERMRERRHHLEFVDLRWGVDTVTSAEEAHKELQVLKVCLAEVERARPFFVALIGDRYGWVPPLNRVQAATKEAGFAGSADGKSITALEIEFGALVKSNERRRCRFYIREPLPYDQMPPEIAAQYSDLLSTDPQAPVAHARLEVLKSQIEGGMKDRVRRYHATWDADRQTVVGLTAWGRQVLEDLWLDLKEETEPYLIKPVPTWEQQEREHLEEFVEQGSRDFVGREEILAELVSFVQSQPGTGTVWGKCIVGESGTGKSALFSKLYSLLNEELLILAHAAGVGLRSTSVDWMLRRWTEELATHLGLGNPLTAALAEQEQEAVFARMIGRASQETRILLLIDSLDSFETPRGQSLAWLPQPLPSNVRVIATGILGPGTKALSHLSGCQLLPIPHLSRNEAKGIVESVCRRYHREINPEVLNALLSRRLTDDTLAAANPLWLELAVEELNLLDSDDFLRAGRDYSGRPDEQLHQLLLDVASSFPPTVEDLSTSMLQRVESVYGERWTQSLINLLVVSVHGWRDIDFRVLLPRLTGEAWDELHFASLRRGFRGHLTQQRSVGQWDFHHKRIRAAAAQRQLTDLTSFEQINAKIADHLEALPPDDPVRQSELMLHLMRSGDPLRTAQYYASDLSPDDLNAATINLAATVMSDADDQKYRWAHWALSLLELETLSYSERGKLCCRYILGLHDVLKSLQDVYPSVAFNLTTEAIRILTTLANSGAGTPEWIRALGVGVRKLGDIVAKYKADLPRALEQYRASVAIADELANRDIRNSEWQNDAVQAHDGVGRILQGQGHVDEALAAFQKAAAICARSAGIDSNNPELQNELCIRKDKIAHVFFLQGRLQDALQLHRESLAIRNRLVSSDPANTEWQDALANDYERTGEIYAAQRDFASSVTQYKASLDVRNRLAKSDSSDGARQAELGKAHLELGTALMRQGQIDESHRVLQEGLAIAQRLVRMDPHHKDWQLQLASSYSRLGELLCRRGELANGLRSYQASHDGLKQLAASDPDNVKWQDLLSCSHKEIGVALLDQDRPTDALQQYQASIAIDRRLASLDTNSATWEKRIAMSEAGLAIVFERLNDEHEKRHHWKRCQQILEDLERRNVLSDPETAELLESLRRAESAAPPNKNDEPSNPLVAATNENIRDPRTRTGAVSFLKTLFSGKRNLRQSQTPAREPSVPADLVAGINTVTEIEERLRKYYAAHRTSDNQILNQVALNLAGHKSALLYLVALPLFGFERTTIRELFRTLEGTGRIVGLEESLTSLLKEVDERLTRNGAPANRERLRKECVDRAMTLLNMYIDVGKRLVLQRELKAKGMSDQEIRRASDASESPNVF